MKRCSLLRRLVWLGLPLLLPGARATTVIAPTFERLVNSADYVVRATVKSVRSEWRENPDNPRKPYIGSLVELDVLEVISGNPPAPLVLRLVGGTIGDKTLTVDGAPRFSVGQESILFIRGNGRQIIPLVAMNHGHYPVRRDRLSGTDQVMRSGGKLLYSEQEVTLPESAASPAPVRDPRARPLTCADFTRLIRSTARHADREKLK